MFFITVEVRRTDGFTSIIDKAVKLAAIASRIVPLPFLDFGDPHGWKFEDPRPVEVILSLNIRGVILTMMSDRKPGVIASDWYRSNNVPATSLHASSHGEMPRPARTSDPRGTNRER